MIAAMFQSISRKARVSNLLAVMMSSIVLLSACGKGGGEKTPATQVAVKVNGDEISVHQINQALSRVGQLTPDQASIAGKKVLEQLIDQQLLIQKSLEKKLDRDPEVLSALEASRRQILSQAYLEKSVAPSVPKPAPEEIKKFYDTHPELFAQRRIYRLQELIVALPPGQLPSLRSETEKTKNLNDVTAWLQANHIRYNANVALRAAEQLPQEALPRIAQMKDSDIGISEGEGGVTVMQLMASQSVPMGEEAARPFIERFLVNQKRAEVAGNELKQLRQSAKLEYMGDFVKTQAAASGVAPEAKKPQAAAAEKADSKTAPSAIDKGVSGLQ